MIKVLDRYILKAFFTNFIIALLVMIGMYIVLDLFVNLDEFTKVPDETTLQVSLKIVRFYGYNLFLYFSQLAGVVILASACFTLARFHRANEFTAILASGTSLYRVASPVMLAALAMNLLWIANQEFVIPEIADKLARKHDDTEGRQTFGVWFRPDREQALVSAAMFSPRTREMRGLIVIKRDEHARMTDVIRADRASWDEERGSWSLENGFISRYAGSATESVLREPIAEYHSELTPKELALQQASQWTRFISLPELTRLQQRFPQTAEFVKVKHTRLTTIFINMLMLLLGIPFFLTRERPQVLVAGAKCLLVCGACFVLTFFCQSVEMVGASFNPALPAWIPVLVFCPVAVYLMDAIKT